MKEFREYTWRVSVWIDNHFISFFYDKLRGCKPLCSYINTEQGSPTSRTAHRHRQQASDTISNSTRSQTTQGLKWLCFFDIVEKACFSCLLVNWWDHTPKEKKGKNTRRFMSLLQRLWGWSYWYGGRGYRYVACVVLSCVVLSSVILSCVVLCCVVLCCVVLTCLVIVLSCFVIVLF